MCEWLAGSTVAGLLLTTPAGPVTTRSLEPATSVISSAVSMVTWLGAVFSTAPAAGVTADGSAWAKALVAPSRATAASVAAAARTTAGFLNRGIGTSLPWTGTQAKRAGVRAGCPRLGGWRSGATLFTPVGRHQLTLMAKSDRAAAPK